MTSNAGEGTSSTGQDCTRGLKQKLPVRVGPSRISCQDSELISHGLVIHLVCVQQAAPAALNAIVVKLRCKPWHLALPHLPTKHIATL